MDLDTSRPSRVASQRNYSGSGAERGGLIEPGRRRTTDSHAEYLLLPTPPGSAPWKLRELWPLVRRFAQSDEKERARVLADASTEQLKELVRRVDADAFAAINRYLDETHDAEEAVPYGNLAQAAMEAAAILRQRGKAR
jgi:hypothetical protein